MALLVSALRCFWQPWLLRTTMAVCRNLDAFCNLAVSGNPACLLQTVWAKAGQKQDFHPRAFHLTSPTIALPPPPRSLSSPPRC